MLYNCKVDGDHYRITKFTPDLEVESTYLTSESECECPAGHRHTCRHRQMLPMFIEKPATRGQYFLDFERKVWLPAVVEEASEVDERIWNQPLPEHPTIEHGFTMLSLADPRTIHNTIADAVVEPEAKVPATPLLRRL